jgi:hypothetical protein
MLPMFTVICIFESIKETGCKSGKAQQTFFMINILLMIACLDIAIFSSPSWQSR